MMIYGHILASLQQHKCLTGVWLFRTTKQKHIFPCSASSYIRTSTGGVSAHSSQ